MKKYNRIYCAGLPVGKQTYIPLATECFFSGLSISTVLILFGLMICLGVPSVYSQTTSSATSGSGGGYSVIKNDGFGIEDPDCKHGSFGPHITQKYDSGLKKNVFIFHSHINQDNDRCKNDDRVRIEIKGGPGASSNTLRHPRNSTSYYRWKFRLPSNFEASNRFCHFFQLKAKGGNNDKPPILTLSAQKDKFELVHNKKNPNSVYVDLKQEPLSKFKGEWIEGYVKIKHGDNGTLNVVLKKVSNGQTVFSYSNSNIDLWRSGADYNRPKWGIYRGKTGGLKDEQVRFADWCVSESSEGQCPSSINTGPNLPPSVSFASPSGDISVDEGYSNFEVTVNASDSDGSINNVKLYVDSDFIRQEVNAPYTWGKGNNADELLGLSVGTHTIKAEATDDDGATTSKTFRLTVNGTTSSQPPLVSFITPSGNIVVDEGYDLKVEANATDPDGDIADVKLYIDNTFVRQESKVPYEWGHDTSPNPQEVNGLSPGTYTFKVVATNSEGITAEDTFVLTVRENNGGGNNNCEFGTPISSGIPMLDDVSFTQAYVLGQGGANLSNFREFSINWNPAHNGLYKFAFNTNNGNPEWYVNFSDTMSYQLQNAYPEITLNNTGFSGLDGSYWVALDGNNIVLVSKDRDFTIYFSNSTQPPSCANRLSKTRITDSLRGIMIFPNPVKSDMLFIDGLDQKELSIEVFGLNGRRVMAEKTKGVDIYQLPIKGLPTGNYILSIQGEGVDRAMHFIKE